MRELQNPFIYKSMKKSRKTIRFIAVSQLILTSALCGCVTKLRDSVQSLPETISHASSNANDKGYPDLSKIPPMPTNMKTDSDWQKHQDKLEAQRAEVDRAPNSRIPTAQEADMTWSAPIKSVFENDPRFTPAPATNENAIAWAARMRAQLESSPKPAENNIQDKE